MAASVPWLPLNDSKKIPQLGLGTWKSPKGEVTNAVYWAIKAGYRHIDCAYVYMNEGEVGDGIQRAIREGLVKREDLFITTKCWLTFLRKDRVAKCLNKSLEKLKLTYVDLYLIHWPMAFKQTDDSLFPESEDTIDVDESIDLSETWIAFEELKKSKIARSIGVSNFNYGQLRNLLASCNVVPAVNQIEFHPYINSVNQERLINLCRENDIQVTSYSPLGSTPPMENVGHSSHMKKGAPRLMDDRVVNAIAKKHNKSAAQILIRYQIERNLIVIPKSTNQSRIIENINVFDFKLDADDMNRLNGINKSYRYCNFDLKGLRDHKEYPFKYEL